MVVLLPARIQTPRLAFDPPRRSGTATDQGAPAPPVIGPDVAGARGQPPVLRWRPGASVFPTPARADSCAGDSTTGRRGRWTRRTARLRSGLAPSDGPAIAQRILAGRAGDVAAVGTIARVAARDCTVAWRAACRPCCLDSRERRSERDGFSHAFRGPRPFAADAIRPEPENACTATCTVAKRPACAVQRNSRWSTRAPRPVARCATDVIIVLECQITLHNSIHDVSCPVHKLTGALRGHACGSRPRVCRVVGGDHRSGARVRGLERLM
jgi:hypothetical protein